MQLVQQGAEKSGHAVTKTQQNNNNKNISLETYQPLHFDKVDMIQLATSAHIIGKLSQNKKKKCRGNCSVCLSVERFII